jgi:acyl-CoA synthetase (AMP-forming)/AMP-acid ligase II
VSLITLLREGAQSAPDQPLVMKRAASVTYGEALTRAEAFASGLYVRTIDRFACVLSDPVDVMVLLAASTAVGAEACVYRPDIEASLLDDYLSTFQQHVVISDRRLDPARADAIPIESLPADEPLPPWEGPYPTLILTTGTTGRPRGVRHDWARLVRSVRPAKEPPGARWLLAYNLNQFAGTQILLHVLKSRATLVVPESNQARDVVAAMRDHEVTHVSATPTFWRLFIAHLDEEQASRLHLDQITIGGEAVPGPLLDSLRRLFPRVRISQIYAGTEFGSVGSVRDLRSGLPVSMLERDQDSEVQLRIRDGELYIRSRTNMLGYYGEPDIEDEWVPTGDLVEVDGDRIVFVGRSTDTINVGGVKVHPLPVEEAAAAAEGVKMVRAYGHPSPITGQIVALDVIKLPGADEARVKESIRVACSSLPPAARPRRIQFVDQIHIQGHKIVRGQRR